MTAAQSTEPHASDHEAARRARRLNTILTFLPRRTLSGLGLVIALLGQVWLYVTPINSTVAVPSALWLSLVGVALFALAQMLPTGSSTGSTLPPRGLWIVAGLTGTLIAALAAYLFERHQVTQYVPIISLWLVPIISLWLLGAGCYVIAFLPSPLTAPDVRGLWRANAREILAVAAVGALGIGLRFYQLGALPVVINGRRPDRDVRAGDVEREPGEPVRALGEHRHALSASDQCRAARSWPVAALAPPAPGDRRSRRSAGRWRSSPRICSRARSVGVAWRSWPRP